MSGIKHISRTIWNSSSQDATTILCARIKVQQILREVLNLPDYCSPLLNSITNSTNIASLHACARQPWLLSDEAEESSA